MKTMIIRTDITRTYKNNGQHLEQCFRYSLTGKIEKADNTPYDKGTDLFQYSIKSARATVCKGTDIKAHLERDKATEFVYITQTGTCYLMDRREYAEFVETFAEVTRESQKNGGAVKMRLRRETPKMLEWLAER